MAGNFQFFGEVLKIICEKSDPGGLADIFNALFPHIKDKDSAAADIPFKSADPFTFIAAMNSGSDDDRRHACESVKRRFEISSGVPASFTLLP
ncbi:MAG: hypothetical protein J5706_03515, partial [Elusimicrobiales bacterium]|nr:hypothetical protein [Elusimicrobiales bacterium]